MEPELILGTRDASPILEPEHASKTGHPRLEGKRVAIIVNHGMGQQVPYETIEGVARAVWRGAGQAASRSVIRRVRLGIEGKDDVEAELVRAEIQIQHEHHAYDVHIYESYWAPLTEGKVSLKDVMFFLFDAGWNGLVNTEIGTFKRWMFGSEQSFKLRKLRLLAILGFLMVLLLALVFMNAVLAAAVASYAIGGSKSFPGNLTAPLTYDFIIADFAAVLIALGTVVLPWVYKKLTKRAGISRWLSWLGWILIIPAAFLIVFAGCAVPLQLAGYHPEHHIWRWLACRAQCLSRGHFWITLLWALELLAAYAARWFLVEYVGDVTAYIAAHTVSKFYDLRQEIWQTAMKVARAVYRAQPEHEVGANQPSFLYDRIIVVGHSLGSVIGYDVLNGLFLEEALSKNPLQIVERTRMFLTFGSPLDKTAFLFRTQADMRSKVREVAAAAVQPMIQNYDNRPLEWVNLYSKSDIISGNLDYYDPPNRKNAKDKTPWKNPATAPVAHERAVKNLIDPAARTPLAAHVEYWTGELFANELVRAIIS